MPLAPIAVPQFPNVPVGAGVPPLPRSPSFPVQNTVVALVADAAEVIGLFTGPQWGIFDNTGSPVIVGDSVFAVDYRKEYRIADFPVVSGGFASFNKVALPFEIRVSFVVTGSSLLGSLIPGAAALSLIGLNPSASGRAQFLAALDQAIASLQLSTVLTPEASYPSVNITHVDFHREARNGGVSMIRVDVWCQEVRVAATTQFTSGEPTGTDSADPGMKSNNNPDPGPGSGTGPKTTGGNSTPTTGSPATPNGATPIDTGAVQPAPAAPPTSAGFVDEFGRTIPPAPLPGAPAPNVPVTTLDSGARVERGYEYVAPPTSAGFVDEFGRIQ